MRKAWPPLLKVADAHRVSADATHLRNVTISTLVGSATGIIFAFASLSRPATEAKVDSGMSLSLLPMLLSLLSSSLLDINQVFNLKDTNEKFTRILRCSYNVVFSGIDFI